MVGATAYLGPAGPGDRAEGGSKAFRVDCDDGIVRVVKVQGNPQGNMVLVNELIASRLAELVAAPCPIGTVVEVPDAVLSDAKDDMSGLDKARPGPAFGSEYFEGIYKPGADVCRQADNRSDLIQLVGLYQWARNHDWKDSHLLHSTDETGATRILGFDNGYCFGNPKWDEAKLKEWLSVPHTLKRTAVDLAIEPGDVERFDSAIRSVSLSQISEATASVPSDWGSIPNTELAEALEGSRLASVTSLRSRYV